VALRLSVFSPTRSAASTPIELMLKLTSSTIPAIRRPNSGQGGGPGSGGSTRRFAGAGRRGRASPTLLRQAPLLTRSTHRSHLPDSMRMCCAIRPHASAAGVSAVQGGAGSAILPRAGGGLEGFPAARRRRGRSAGVRGHERHRSRTVTYNDGNAFLAFGHPFSTSGRSTCR